MGPRRDCARTPCLPFRGVSGGGEGAEVIVVRTERPAFARFASCRNGNVGAQTAQIGPLLTKDSHPSATAEPAACPSMSTRMNASGRNDERGRRRVMFILEFRNRREAPIH